MIIKRIFQLLIFILVVVSSLSAIAQQYTLPHDHTTRGRGGSLGVVDISGITVDQADWNLLNNGGGIYLNTLENGLGYIGIHAGDDLTLGSENNAYLNANFLVEVSSNSGDVSLVGATGINLDSGSGNVDITGGLDVSGSVNLGTLTLDNIRALTGSTISIGDGIDDTVTVGPFLSVLELQPNRIVMNGASAITNTIGVGNVRIANGSITGTGALSVSSSSTVAISSGSSLVLNINNGNGGAVDICQSVDCTVSIDGVLDVEGDSNLTGDVAVVGSLTVNGVDVSAALSSSTKVLSADFTSTSDNILSDLTDLASDSFALGCFVAVEGRAVVSGAGGAKWAFSGTSSVSAESTVSYTHSKNTGAPDTSSDNVKPAFSSASFATFSADEEYFTISGVVEIAGAGTLVLQSAQTASNATGLTVHAGSYVKYEALSCP